MFTIDVDRKKRQAPRSNIISKTLILFYYLIYDQVRQAWKSYQRNSTIQMRSRNKTWIMLQFLASKIILNILHGLFSMVASSSDRSKCKMAKKMKKSSSSEGTNPGYALEPKLSIWVVFWSTNLNWIRHIPQKCLTENVEEHQKMNEPTHAYFKHPRNWTLQAPCNFKED